MTAICSGVNRHRYALATMLALQIPLPTMADPRSCKGVLTSRFVMTRDQDGEPEVHERALDPALTPSQLACLSDQGHRLAAFELGRRYEEGNGVTVDLKRAEKLYRQAATDVPDVRTVYRPAVTPVGSGGILVLPDPDASLGLPEAKERLKLLRLRKPLMRESDGLLASRRPPPHVKKVESGR